MPKLKGHEPPLDDILESESIGVSAHLALTVRRHRRRSRKACAARELERTSPRIPGRDARRETSVSICRAYRSSVDEVPLPYRAKGIVGGRVRYHGHGDDYGGGLDCPSCRFLCG